MRSSAGVSFLAALAVFMFVIGVEAAQAQQNTGGCTVEQIGGTARRLLRCNNGLSVISEAGASYVVLDRNRDRNADSVRLNSGALLLEYNPAGQSQTPIEVIAPQAIAAVRGTKWAVDAQASRTSVFVVNGSVAVRRSSGANGVVLGAGEGVDVGAGTGPLEVKRWPAARVSALLARFGQ